MDSSRQEREGKNKIAEVKTFPVPFPLEENPVNLTIYTNTPSKPSKEQLIDQAFRFHSQGNILEAEKYYKYLINQGFNDQRVFSNYGLILRDQGKLKDAEFTTRKAIELKNNYAEAHSNLGNILRDLGKLKEAEKSYRKAIEINPNFAEAHYNLGTIFLDHDNLKEARIVYLKAIEINPNFAEAHYNLGNVLRDLGNLKEAEIAYRKAIKIKPKYAEANSNLGNVLIDLGNLKEAELSARQAIKIQPSLAEAHSNLGNILRNLGKLKEAELSTRKAIKIQPNFAEAHSNMGSILRDLSKLKDAEISTRKAIELNPHFADAHYNLGNIVSDLGNFPDAINHYKEALILNNKLSIAKAALIETKGTICDWSNEETHTRWLESLGIEGGSICPLKLFSLEDNPLKHLKRSEKYYKEKYTRPTRNIKFSQNNLIHIGYFSADFRNHAVMNLIAPLFELHNKSRFKIYLYSFVPKEDEYTERAKNSGCIFRDIKTLNDIEVVELARSDKLDIAVDLMGYTRYNRMHIFSYRMAAIQINYIGFPGSVGSDTIDYIIADKIIIPKENEKFYSEKIIQMPNCYQCNDHKQKISQESLLRKDFNLPDQGFIFTCFNNNYKITKKEFNIWMNLLIKIEGSVLWLYKSNQWSRNNLYKEARKRKVDPDRLIFAEKLPLNKHLARHSLGDLALDTFNFNGGSTTSYALWGGLPVLTKIGQSFIARISASILTSIGLPELITYSESEYEEKALYIASNPEEVLRLKSKLNKLKKISPLYKTELFTQDLENIYLDLIKQSF